MSETQDTLRHRNRVCDSPNQAKPKPEQENEPFVTPATLFVTPKIAQGPHHNNKTQTFVTPQICMEFEKGRGSLTTAKILAQHVRL